MEIGIGESRVYTGLDRPASFGEMIQSPYLIFGLAKVLTTKIISVVNTDKKPFLRPYQSQRFPFHLSVKNKLILVATFSNFLYDY